MSVDKAFIMHSEEGEAAELWIVEHVCDPLIDPTIAYTFSGGSGVGRGGRADD